MLLYGAPSPHVVFSKGPTTPDGEEVPVLEELSSTLELELLSALELEPPSTLELEFSSTLELEPSYKLELELEEPRGSSSKTSSKLCLPQEKRSSVAVSSASVENSVLRISVM
jgi:hypothetical protein